MGIELLNEKLVKQPTKVNRILKCMNYEIYFDYENNC